MAAAKNVNTDFYHNEERLVTWIVSYQEGAANYVQMFDWAGYPHGTWSKTEGGLFTHRSEWYHGDLLKAFWYEHGCTHEIVCVDNQRCQYPAPANPIITRVQVMHYCESVSEKTIKEEYYDSDGRPHGDWTIDNSVRYVRESFVHGLRHGEKTEIELCGGQPWTTSVSRWKNGKLHDDVTVTDVHGNVIEHAIYENGVLLKGDGFELSPDKKMLRALAKEGKYVKYDGNWYTSHKSSTTTYEGTPTKYVARKVTRTYPDGMDIESWKVIDGEVTEVCRW